LKDRGNGLQLDKRHFHLCDRMQAAHVQWRKQRRAFKKVFRVFTAKGGNGNAVRLCKYAFYDTSSPNVLCELKNVTWPRYGCKFYHVPRKRKRLKAALPNIRLCYHETYAVEILGTSNAAPSIMEFLSANEILR